jgi:fructose-1,6-bisphosphatase/inositol monophosphatase family enzyme
MHWWINEQERRALSDIEMASRSASHARTLEELARAKSHVSVSTVARHQPRVRAALMTLEQVAETRADAFCNELMHLLDTAPGDAAVRAKVGVAYRSCCGVFPKQARRLFDALIRSRRDSRREGDC